MTKNKIKYLIFTVFAFIISALLEPTGANAGTYVTTSTIISTNILTGQPAGSITSFVYNLSAKPAPSTAVVSFSQNGSNWYNSSGTLNGTNTLTTGTNNTINLSGLGWSGANFYYKIVFGGDGNVTPVLDDITVNYSGGTASVASNTANATVSTDSYFIGITDGDNPARLIDGVDAGTGTTNTGTITISNGATLTVNSNETIVAGSFIITSGSIVINSGGVLKPGGALFAADADGDGYPGSSNVLYNRNGTSPSGFKRRNAMTSISTLDCNDSAYSLTNVCTGDNGAVCTLDSQCTSVICGTDADGDLLFSAAAGHTGTCHATAYAYTDTNDSQYCPAGYNPGNACDKCVSGAIAVQTSGEDIFSECTAGNCATGNCSGSGYSCQSSGTWTESCQTCFTCCNNPSTAELCGQTCSGGTGCNGCACSVGPTCSDQTVWNGAHTCYCSYCRVNNGCPTSCNCTYSCQ